MSGRMRTCAGSPLAISDDDVSIRTLTHVAASTTRQATFGGDKGRDGLPSNGGLIPTPAVPASANLTNIPASANAADAAAADYPTDPKFIWSDAAFRST